jgi:hypothetical protein
MQYTINHAGVEKRARGKMYNAFRLGVETNDQGVQPDYDIVLQSKQQKGYKTQGVLPKGENENKISTYFNNQEPLRSGTFKENLQQFKTHLTPAIQASVLAAAGAGGVAASAPNMIGAASGTNLVQVLQGAGETPTSPYWGTPVSSSNPPSTPTSSLAFSPASYLGSPPAYASPPGQMMQVTPQKGPPLTARQQDLAIKKALDDQKRKAAAAAAGGKKGASKRN